MDKNHKYQNDLSLQSPILLDRAHKSPKVMKMISVLDDAELINKGGVAVDVGCSIGFFIGALSPYFDKAIGVDIDKHALGLAGVENTEDVYFVCADSMCLPFQDSSVDFILCNHVYEHVPDSCLLFSEIERVLKPGGVCYLGAASKYTIIEPHYHLPLLSWIPKRLAHLYMRLCRKGDFYYENLVSRSAIATLIDRFDVEDYTLKIIAEPDKYHARDMIRKGGVVELVPLFVWKALYYLLPSYIILLRKRVEG